MQTVHPALPAFWYGVQEFANPFLTLGYSAVIVWLTRYRWAGPVALLAPAGRMTASNYIGQSVIMMLLYTGYGLALADCIPPAGVVLLAVLTYLAQLRISAWWLRRHHYGPIEWVLRAATYGSLTRAAWVRR
ncbi:DUF418 domain-containing protein [Nocardia yunnanensis]|uniref:DUF418 domain-containing protein n=1 Tax=Nocardia yunnanensis TaxID=2382165 RepID=UPI001FEA73D0|nr:DUF418 domain-containing protein [Nocardia yunnanensis]